MKETLLLKLPLLELFLKIFIISFLGAPKIKAMELISSLEKGKRGIYAGKERESDYTCQPCQLKKKKKLTHTQKK